MDLLSENLLKGVRNEGDLNKRNNMKSFGVDEK